MLRVLIFLVSLGTRAFPYDTAPRYLIFDRDSIFSPAVVEFIKAMGTKPVRIGCRSPWQNGTAERWIGSCRRELLEQVVVLSERHFIASYGPTSATTTKIVAAWGSTRMRRTRELPHLGHPQRRESLHCREWVDCTTGTNGARLRSAVFGHESRVAGPSIVAFSSS